MSDMDALVELAARALAMLEPGEDWPTNAALGGNGTGTRDDEYRAALTDQAREILEAVGLPALLERVEAAEGGRATASAKVHRLNPLLDDAIRERDALAAKVTDAGERIAQAIEAEAAELANDPGHPMFESGAQSAFVLAAALARHASETP